MRNLLIFAVVALISEGSGRRQKERAGDDGGDEWESKEKKRVLSEGFAIFGGKGVGKRSREGFGGERRHGEGRTCSVASCRAIQWIVPSMS